jgi:hypothetical protein
LVVPGLGEVKMDGGRKGREGGLCIGQRPLAAGVAGRDGQARCVRRKVSGQARRAQRTARKRSPTDHIQCPTSACS